MPAPTELTRDQVAELFDLRPLPVEGGWYRQTWRGPDDPDGRPAGTAILLLLFDDPASNAGFSAMHRLRHDELWHFHLGSPVELLLLEPGGRWRIERLGADLAAGQRVQITVPGGVWMGASVAGAGSWALLGCTMAPGFVPADYEGGDAGALCLAYPGAETHIRRLCRPDAPRHLPPDVDP